MKVCMCRDFDEAAMRRAIKDNNPQHPEDLHRLIKGQDPNCGTCLCTIQAVLEEYRETGEVPPTLGIRMDKQDAMAEKLADRFAAETQDIKDKREIPTYKRRYLALHKRKNNSVEPG